MGAAECYRRWVAPPPADLVALKRSKDRHRLPRMPPSAHLPALPGVCPLLFSPNCPQPLTIAPSSCSSASHILRYEGTADRLLTVQLLPAALALAQAAPPQVQLQVPSSARRRQRELWRGICCIFGR